MARNDQHTEIHQLILEEVKTTREEVRGLYPLLGGKVGRSELYSVLGVIGVVIGTVLAFV